MNIEKIEMIMADALKENCNLKINKLYQDAMSMYLEEHKSSDEIITVVVKGFKIDQGANFFDYLESVEEDELLKVWKQIRKNKTIKENYDNKGLAFLAALFSLMLMNKRILISQQHSILDSMMSLIGVKKRKVDKNIYETIIKEYIVDNFIPKYNFPKWASLQASGEYQKEFAKIILEITEKEDNDSYDTIQNWAKEGLKLAEDKIYKEQIEKKIPKSKIIELQEILEHYKLVESQVKQEVYELAEKEKLEIKLQQRINNLQEEKRVLEKEVKSLKVQINLVQQNLDDAEKKIIEHKVINESFNIAKEQEEVALLKGIAEEISAEYKDFKESQNDEMDILLGEIYREKLNNIFKLLERKGIKME